MSVAEASSAVSSIRLAKTMATRVLVVDDDPDVRRSTQRVLQHHGIEVVVVDGGAAALDALEAHRFQVAMIDLMMPGMDGLELLERVRAVHPDIEIVMMTAYGAVELAVRSVRAGAYDFLEKPFRSNEEVVLTVNKAAERRRLLNRNAILERRLEQDGAFGDLLGTSPNMREVYRRAIGVAPTSSTVLILGESGTGKEVTARAIHKNSPRANEAFVAVNCSAIPDNLVESELFGHVRGSFTGAVDREGLFATADKGTLFLDEVGDLPLSAQVKLLRALQEGEIRPLGSNRTRRVDVRVLAATNVDLRERISAGRFREDLYYRLNVVSIELPPLRQRKDDIPILAQHFLRYYAGKAGREVTRISLDAMARLRAYAWPGNVRELQNAIEHAIVFCNTDAIEPEDLPNSRLSGSKVEPELVSEGHLVAIPESVAQLPYREAKERALASFNSAYFDLVLRRNGGNVSRAARQAGLDRSNFRRVSRRVTDN